MLIFAKNILKIGYDHIFNNDAIIISPSGQLYGSERVLNDYLSISSKAYQVYVPKGAFYNFLKEKKLPRVNLHCFNSVFLLYLRIIISLLLHRIPYLYCNEGGHIKYIKVLASLFPKIKFYVHIRIKEDCSESRLGNIPQNLNLIVVSYYLKAEFPIYLSSLVKVIHDPYSFQTEISSFPIKKITHIGVVGRISKTKGLDKLRNTIRELEDRKCKLVIHLFGTYDENDLDVKEFQLETKENKWTFIKWEGFVTSTEMIYEKIDCVWHFSTVEPLGRIFFEALDFGKYFVGFSAGGIGEIAQSLGINSYMVQDTPNYINSFIQTIDVLGTQEVAYSYALARTKIQSSYSALKYVKELEMCFR